jgi:hypothetical protein
MSIYICSSCNKDFRYNSLLLRHQRNKKSCKLEINNTNQDNQLNNYSNINSDDNDLIVKILQDIMKQTYIQNVDKVKLAEVIIKNKINKDIHTIPALIPTIQEQLLNDNVNLNTITNVVDNDNSIEKNKNKILNKNMCKNCKFIFASRQSLYNHRKNLRCKFINKQQPLQPPPKQLNNTDNIDNTTNNVISNFNNTTNTNSNNNIITINNNIYNNTPNPFGCESLEHITFKDFRLIFNNFNGILQKICHYVYNKNSNNMSFYKNNQNKTIVSYLDKNLDIVSISEKEFIKELKTNIINLSIELFHIFKSEVNIDELICYMRNFLCCQDSIKETNNDEDLKKSLQAIVDKIFRDDEIKQSIKQFEKNLKQNPKLLKSTKCKIENILHDKFNKINEFYKPILTNDNIKYITSTEKNLYDIRKQAFDANTYNKLEII